MNQSVIICVDDEKIILETLKMQLKRVFNGDYIMEFAESGEEALELAREYSEKNMEVALIISDYLMPGMKGDELLIKLHEVSPHTLKILLTGQADLEAVTRVINNSGLYRYISKPWEINDLLLTVQEAAHKFQSDKLIEEKNKKIENLTIAMVTALETVHLYNEEETGKHIKRVSSYSRFLAEKIGMNPIFNRRIELYSSLHDIGKLGISSAIWNKPGALSEEERKIMQQHVVLGGKMLDNSEIDVMAKNIALYHHEKWDGSGYAAGLKGNEIPIEARIVSIADVFDALSSKRIYKEAFSLDNVIQTMKENRGKHFDPDILDVFLGNIDQVKQIMMDIS